MVESIIGGAVGVDEIGAVGQGQQQRAENTQGTQREHTETEIEVTHAEA
jgi:hypothetical protein